MRDKRRRWCDGRVQVGRSLSFAAAVVQDGVSGRSSHTPCGALGHAGRRDVGYLEPPQLNFRPGRRPQGGDIVGRIALLSQLQEEAEPDRAIPRAALQNLAQKFALRLIASLSDSLSC